MSVRQIDHIRCPISWQQTYTYLSGSINAFLTTFLFRLLSEMATAPMQVAHATVCGLAHACSEQRLSRRILSSRG